MQHVSRIRGPGTPAVPPKPGALRALAPLLAGLAGACGGGGSAELAEVSPAVHARLEAFVEASPTATKTALLVGVDDYASGTERQFPDLEGCVNDVRRMEDLLVESFGFDPDEIFVLLDHEATHANLVHAFDRVLIDRAGPDSMAVFFFAGHGSRVPDRAPDGSAEPDRLDSTFLTHDSRGGGLSGERDFSDDELRCLVAALTERTDHVTVITDSCHSGGGLRGASRLVPRAAPPGSHALDTAWISSFWPEDVPLVEDSPDEQVLADRYVHVAACRRDQVAYEHESVDEDGEPRVHGALTHFLGLTLEHSRPGDSWRAIVDDAAARLAAQVPGQTVSYSGAVDREIFGADFVRLAGYVAEAIDGSTVLVKGGSLHGLREGSVLGVYDATAENRLAEAEVTRINGRICRARIRGAALDPVPTGALRAIEESRPGGQPPLRVRAADPELRVLLAASDLAELADDDAPGPEGLDAAYELTRRADGRVDLTMAEGLLVGRAEAPGEGAADLESELRRLLHEELRWRALCELGNERGSYPLEARFRAPTPDELENLPDDYLAVDLSAEAESDVLEPAGGALDVTGAFDDEDPKRAIVLELRNPHGVDLYAHVFSISEDRFRTPILPAPGYEPPLLAANGGTRDVNIGVVSRRDWPFERPMLDRYLVIATQRRADFHQFSAEGVLRGGGPSTEPPAILKQAFQVPLTRGGPVAKVDASDWGVTTVDLLVESPEVAPTFDGLR